MYAIKRSDDLFLCDGAVYVNAKLPQPIWQNLEGTRNLYLEESLRLITLRKDRIAKIYTKHKLTIHELNEEELEYLSFRKLRGY